MTFQHSKPTDVTSHEPLGEAADLDAFMVDEEFDDCLDRQVHAIRESLADVRNV
jgi:hypothetical protein